MKVVFKPTRFIEMSGISVKFPNNACNGVDNENPSIVESNSGGYARLNDFRGEHVRIEDFFYNAKDKWYVKKVTLKVKIGTESSTQPADESYWNSTLCSTSQSYPKNETVIPDLAESDMYPVSSYANIDDYFHRQIALSNRDDGESFHVNFHLTSTIGQTVYVYGAEIEVEYEDCVPVTFGNFTSPSISPITVRYPGTTSPRTVLSGVANYIPQYTIENEVVGAPLGSTIQFDMTPPKAPRLYVNDVDIADRAEYMSGNLIRYITDPIEGPTDIIATASTMGSKLMAATYEKKNGRWSINNSPRTIIDVNEKYHKG